MREHERQPASVGPAGESRKALESHTVAWCERMVAKHPWMTWAEAELLLKCYRYRSALEAVLKTPEDLQVKLIAGALLGEDYGREGMVLFSPELNGRLPR